MFRRSSYQVPDATITVRRASGGWMMRVSTGQCAVEFPFDSSVFRAAKWLASEARGNWRGEFASLIRPDMTWNELVAVVRGEPVVPAMVSPVQITLTDDQIQLILEAHYRQVLASKEGRAMWTRLVREASTLEKAAKIRRDAGRP